MMTKGYAAVRYDCVDCGNSGKDETVKPPVGSFVFGRVLF